MKTKKCHKIIIITFILSIMCLLVACSDDLDAERLKKEYGVILPQDIETEYKTNQTGWFGDGIMYTVFKLKEETISEFFSQFIPKNPMDASNPLKTPFSEQKNIGFESEIESLVSGMEIPENYLFNWEKDYSFKKDIGGLYMIYFPDINRLILISIRM